MHDLRVEKAVGSTRSAADSAVWLVRDLQGNDLGLWVSKIYSYGWCATYASGTDMKGMRLAGMMRGKNFPTRRELLQEVSCALLARDYS